MFDCTYLTGSFEAGNADLFSPQPPAFVEDARRLIAGALREHDGRVAVVSSFGAESAVLLALVADVDPAAAVLFIDTRQHFAETLAYRQDLAAFLGLTNVRDVSLTDAEEAAHDPDRQLWQFDPDACCHLRKVLPLERALAPFPAWMTGRKRHQTRMRAALPLRETLDGKVKYNPLAGWTPSQIQSEFLRRGLPRHRLSLAGFASIGCTTCTRAVAAGEDPRAGRWAGTGKTECGIHRPAQPAYLPPEAA